MLGRHRDISVVLIVANLCLIASVLNQFSNTAASVVMPWSPATMNGPEGMSCSDGLAINKFSQMVVAPLICIKDKS